MLVRGKGPVYWQHITLDSHPLAYASGMIVNRTVAAIAYKVGQEDEQIQVYGLHKLPVRGWIPMTGLTQMVQYCKQIIAKRASVDKEGH